jgi:hypothetical protein
MFVARERSAFLSVGSILARVSLVGAPRVRRWPASVPAVLRDCIRSGSSNGEEAFQAGLLIVLGVMLVVAAVAAQVFGAAAPV